MKTIKILLIIILFVLIFVPEAYSGIGKDFYYRGIRFARKGEIDFAFSYFDMIVRTHPESRYFEDSLFVIGEYHFSNGDMNSAKKTFEQFIESYPESEAKLFALIHLFIMAEKQGKKDIAEDLKKEIISFKQVSLFFRDSEQIEYSSAFSTNYKAVYFIDRIEIFINEDSFAKIPF